MPISSPRLRRLDQILLDIASDDAMLLSELDGYVTGILICPDLIMPGEWLPEVWGGAGGRAPFDDERDVRWFIDKVMQHYNAVAAGLLKGHGRFTPVFDTDVRHGEILWEIWIEGFACAVDLRPESWAQITEDDDQAAADAFDGLATLIAIADDSSDLERSIIDDLTARGHDLIPRWVEALHAWRLNNQVHQAVTTAPIATKFGRNDPCGCGSGRKYKKCCGLN